MVMGMNQFSKLIMVASRQGNDNFIMCNQLIRVVIMATNIVGNMFNCFQL